MLRFDLVVVDEVRDAGGQDCGLATARSGMDGKPSAGIGSDGFALCPVQAVEEMRAERRSTVIQLGGESIRSAGNSRRGAGSVVLLVEIVRRLHSVRRALQGGVESCSTKSKFRVVGKRSAS